jgi:hypothetical protein
VAILLTGGAGVTILVTGEEVLPPPPVPGAEGTGAREETAGEATPIEDKDPLALPSSCFQHGSLICGPCRGGGWIRFHTYSFTRS